MKEEILSIASDLREGYMSTNEAKEYFRKAMEEYSHKQLVKFCDHLNTYAGLEDCRFDFMLVDFKQST